RKSRWANYTGRGRERLRKQGRRDDPLGRSRACVDERFLQEVEASAEILVGYDERDENPDDVPVEAAREEDEPALAGGHSGRAGERGCRRLRLAILDELDRQHRPQSADFADRLDAARYRLEAGANPLSELVGTPAELVARDLIEYDQGRGARERVAAEGAAETAGRHGVHDLPRPGDAREREAPAERLAGDKEVGLDV